MRRKFLKHQLQAWKYAKNKSTMALFMQMRLGKTLVSIRWAKTRFNCKDRLVICPLSVIPSWQEEIAIEGFSCINLRDYINDLDNLPDADFYIGNYEMFIKTGEKTYQGNKKAVAKGPANYLWDLVIVDESTRIKEPKSSITKVILKELAHVKYKCILTGKPNPENQLNFVTQMIFTFGSFMGKDNFWKWRSNYTIDGYGGGVEFSMRHAGKLKKEVHLKAFCLSRKEAGLKGDPIFERRYVQLSKKIMSAIHKTLTTFEIPGKLSMNKLPALLWVQRITGGRIPEIENYQHDAKFNEVNYLLRTELKNELVIVYCRFTAEIKYLYEKLSVKNKCGIVYGDQGSKLNDKNIQKFRKGKLKYLIGQPKIMQMGLDLSISDTIINYSSHWSSEIRQQSVMRASHPLKETSPLIIDIVAKDTPDEDLYNTLEEKEMDSKLFLSRFAERILKRYGNKTQKKK